MYANFIVGLENLAPSSISGEDKGPAILGPTVQLSVPNFPTYYTFATNILIGKVDLTKKNKLKAKMFRKDNKEDIIFEIDTELPLSYEPGDKQASINLTGEVRNGYFESEGEYRCIITVNDEQLCDAPLYITREIKGD